MITEQMLCQWAYALGFAKASFCSTAGFEKARQTVEAQQPLSERKQLRFYPAQDFPRAKSLAVLLWPYLPAASAGDGKVFVDSYYEASNAAYHAARKLEAQLLDAGCFASANVSYPAKEAAVRAGLGVIGKNSLLITPQYGTRVVIILMATSIEIKEEPPDERIEPSCLNCGHCMRACPSGAIDDKGMSHPERCLRNFMMEGVVVPEKLRSSIGMSLIGCDVCQRVCPMQPEAASLKPQCHALDSFVTADPAKYSAALSVLAAEIGRNTARPQRVRAQAALLAGNSRDSCYLDVLQEWAKSPFEAVREHALWAIRRIETTSPGLDRKGESI